jgi:hypothetical protein
MQLILSTFSALGAVVASLLHIGGGAAIPAVVGGAAGLIYDRLTHRGDRRN